MVKEAGALFGLFGDNADKHAKDSLAREREERANHHATLNERLTYLEGLFGDNADKHAKELAQIQSTHQQLSYDVRMHGGNHGGMVERCNHLERLIAELAERQNKDTRDAQTKFDLLS